MQLEVNFWNKQYVYGYVYMDLDFVFNDIEGVGVILKILNKVIELFCS